jgi:hypothetical protein
LDSITYMASAEEEYEMEAKADIMYRDWVKEDYEVNNGYDIMAGAVHQPAQHHTGDQRLITPGRRHTPQDSAREEALQNSALPEAVQEAVHTALDTALSTISSVQDTLAGAIQATQEAASTTELAATAASQALSDTFTYDTPTDAAQALAAAQLASATEEAGWATAQAIDAAQAAVVAAAKASAIAGALAAGLELPADDQYVASVIQEQEQYDEVADAFWYSFAEEEQEEDEERYDLQEWADPGWYWYDSYYYNFWEDTEQGAEAASAYYEAAAGSGDVAPLDTSYAQDQTDQLSSTEFWQKELTDLAEEVQSALAEAVQDLSAATPGVTADMFDYDLLLLQAQRTEQYDRQLLEQYSEA